MSSKAKMYILILDTVDLGHAILGAAHASLGGYLDFTDGMLHPEGVNAATIDWAKESFRKVVCKVTVREFSKAKEVAKEHSLPYRIMTESALDDGEVSLVFAPRVEWPKFFQFLKLYR